MMKHRFLSFLFAIASCTAQLASAADITLTPSIGLAAYYDDNITFESDDAKKDDVIFSVDPGIIYDYATEINQLRAMAFVSAQNYVENDKYNAIDQHYRLKGEANLTELLTFEADLKYVKDDTLKSQLDETGRVSEEREDRQRYYLNSRLFFNLTELIRVGGRYQYRQTDFDSDITEDYNDDIIGVIYNQRLKNQLDSINFNTSYAYRKVRTHETNIYRMNFGWGREFSETFRINVIVGGRLTEQYTFDSNSRRTKNESSGFLADVSFYKNTDNMLTELRYLRDQVYDAYGGALEVDQINLVLDRNLSERLVFGIGLKFYWSRDVDDSSTDDSRYYEAKPKISYNLTENHKLGLYYSYQYDYDENLTDTNGDDTKDRNKVWLSLEFNFPKKI